MPTLQQLRYLVAIADTLSFSRAAEMRRVAQSTLSIQLKELETKLGARLVERTRAKVILTPIGQEIARRARAIIAEVEDIREISLRNDPDAPQTMLQIGVVQTVGAYALSVAMPSLRQAFPNMRIWVREEHANTLLRQLVDGVHDVLLLPEEVDRQDLECHRLLVEPLLVVLPADHPLAGKDSISPGDLAGQTILTMERGQRSLHDQIVRLCGAVGAIHARDYEGTTLDTLRQMVATGMGISLLPALYVRSEVMREQLVVARPMSSGAPVRHVSLIWRRNSPRQHTYEAVAGNLRQSLSPWGAVETEQG
ncbi:hydrogen peroxide-inducible genes activator [Paracoccus siganidrum]|uniref:Hydrogen peroxide-inducible genes activator n=1 Tax=Paracoccus siganidrum TaxID=1276757 RepID=A0A418ZUP5_9RHOB|nr:hydrogen peroxide-inducible genes activator [Paracoccus siganidrum]RJL01454.1 hydrogen peroxide-inducible genes activator [Paracoccus siganidrum]RMC24712.1 hydrogen peroxide-inducible genes activator [Paracoccus siganidrum]